MPNSASVSQYSNITCIYTGTHAETPTPDRYDLTTINLVADLGEDSLSLADVSGDGPRLDLDAKVVVVAASERTLVVGLGAAAAELLEDLDLSKSTHPCKIWKRDISGTSYVLSLQLIRCKRQAQTIAAWAVAMQHINLHFTPPILLLLCDKVRLHRAPQTSISDDSIDILQCSEKELTMGARLRGRPFWYLE
jgi:hypothetical protein